MTEQLRIFVSHHHSPEEDAFTARLVDDLHQSGATTWVDVADIREGDFIERINTALSTSNWVVLVLTPAALRSQPVRTEINAALNLVWQGRLRGVIPLEAQPCEPAEIPPTWSTLQRYDATGDYLAAFVALCRALGLDGTVGENSREQLSASVQPWRRASTYQPPLSATASQHIPAWLAELGFQVRTAANSVVVIPPVVSIPAGAFILGSDRSQDTSATEQELPQQHLVLPTYQISSFPVTVSEYACFVRDGHERPQQWPLQLAKPDHPVVYVTWYDAIAYATWLAERTGTSWRVPTEAEWEKAARGSDGRIYPWGNQWDPTRCNCAWSKPKVGSTTPVGSYPSGASPYSVQDMAGNVWEWTSSQFKPYPYEAADGRETFDSAQERVLRGGSWGYDAEGVRATYRIRSEPSGCSGLSGFRLHRRLPSARLSVSTM